MGGEEMSNLEATEKKVFESFYLTIPTVFITIAS